ncbi:MAG: hypothetical protein ACXAEU_16340 [Candidatus Hodarchaeales archaeon]
MDKEESIHEHGLEYIEITPNIITTAIYPHETNQLLRSFETATMSCIALPGELYFVDSGAIMDNAVKFRADMEERFDRPATHLLLTHDHWHSCWGMGAFKDVTTVISSAGRSYYKRNLKKGIYAGYRENILQWARDDERLRESLLSTELFVPAVAVSKEKAFGQEPDQIILKVTGGHTKPSSSIHVPAEKTLFTGGNLCTCYAQSIWWTGAIDIYKEWESLDIEYVVPGHGHVVNKDYITGIRIWFEELLEKLRELKKEGLTKAKVLKRSDLPEYPGKNQKSWIEGSVYHTTAVENNIKWWYGQLLKEAEEDLMFIS